MDNGENMRVWWRVQPRLLTQKRGQFLHYNMAGVAVAIAVSTMHGKSYIDSHNARKSEKKFQNPVIRTSRNQNDEIAEVPQSWMS